MKERMKKILSLILVAGLMFGAIGGTVYAINNENAEKEIVRQEQEAEIEEVKTDGASVYVFTEESGKVQNVIATDDILDEAKVDEKNIHKELPIEIKIKYILDGKEVKPEDLAGKSGHLVMRYDYKNNQSQMMNVNGNSERIYVPYAMVTGIVFDDEACKNIEVVNGKMVDDGSRTVVAGVALPGLQSNLRVSKSDIDIPDYVEISADIENYEHPEAITIATSQIFANLDTSALNDVDGLKESMDKLTDAMDQLMDGSKQLYDGLTLLSEKSAQLKDGVDQLYAGSSALKDGVAALDGGASDLQAGAAQLVAGLETLTGNNAALTGGAKQVYNTLLSVGTEQLKAAGMDVPALSIENYSQVLGGIINSLDKDAVYNQALAKVTAGVEEKLPLIEAGVKSAVKTEVEGKVAAGAKLKAIQGVLDQVNAVAGTTYTAEQYVSLSDAEKVAIDAMLTSVGKPDLNTIVTAELAKPENVAAKEAAVEANMNSDEVKAIIANNIEITKQAKIAEAMAGDEVKATLAKADAGAKAVIELKTSLDSYNAFYKGVLAYTDGVSTALGGANQLKAGTDTLKAGSAQLAAGSVQLYDGISELRGNTPALVDGVNQLKDGSSKLADGLVQLNEEGIDKLVEAYDGDIAPLTARVRATVDAAKSHSTFAGVSKDKDNEIKYIFRTK